MNSRLQGRDVARAVQLEGLPVRPTGAARPQAIVVSFQWKNPDFLLQNPEFLFRNPDFLLKNVAFVIKNTGRAGSRGEEGGRLGQGEGGDPGDEEAPVQGEGGVGGARHGRERANLIARVLPVSCLACRGARCGLEYGPR